MLKVGRLLTALLGALTVWAIVVLGTHLFGRTAGWFAGATYAIMPAAVVHAHYATVDVPATFFVTVALLFGARLLNSEGVKGCRGKGVKEDIPVSPVRAENRASADAIPAGPSSMGEHRSLETATDPIHERRKPQNAWWSVRRRCRRTSR